jgi:GR25 family glycosyltransferase involved in LPS biosynthesis
MTNNICFKIFHVDSNSERDQLFSDLRSYLINKIDELDTPTNIISNDSDVKNFISDNLDFNLYLNGYNLDNIQGWRYGEIGILSSNFYAWKNFINSDYDLLILMEDDIRYDDEFYEKLNLCINDLPDDWDIFSFYVPESEYNKFHLSMAVSPVLSRSYQDWSMLCYVINKKGAQKLIDSVKNPVFLPLDWHIYRQTHLFNVYSVRPDFISGCSLAAVESTFQNIQNRRVLNGIF